MRTINLAKSLFLFFFILGTINSCTTSRNTTVSNKTSTKNTSSNTSNEKGQTSLNTTKLPEKTPEFTPKKEEIIRVNLPEINREFRGAWIASVANINWPSKKYLSTEEQKAEAIHILDVLKENNFNAVIFQARPSGDALYDSPYEPWSVFLTGETGKAPSPYYDPLLFWIEEAHKRGMELHVWLNPYRAHHTNGGKVNSASIVHKMSDCIVKLKNGMYWFDPSSKKTQDHVSQVVMDIVTRYDIDGIHFDDYFYPYASYNNGADFPDQASWKAYQSSGGNLSKADWRRENVNQFIERIYTEIKTQKNWVKFGISPFGIWKSGFPNGVSGMSQYDELYADAKLWLNKGWIDYFTPQLYWPIDSKQSFPSLLSWWESENTYKRHLWPGLNTVEIKSYDKSGEILNQIEKTRQLVPGSKGVVHWSMAGLNSSMLYSLKSGPYQEKALVPKSPWLKPLISDLPNLELSDLQTNIQVEWTIKNLQNISNWLLYKRYGDHWETEILEPGTTVQTLQKHKNGRKLDLVVIQAVDRLGNETDYVAKEVS